MHIVMVTLFPETPEKIDGGVAGVAKYIAEEFAKLENIKLTVVVPTLKPGENRYENWSEFTVCRIGQKIPWSVLPPIVYEILFRRAQFRKLFKELQPDIVHFQGRAFWALNCKVPNVVTIHGIAERDVLWENKNPVRYLKYLLFRGIEGISRRLIKNIIIINEYVNEFLPKKSAQNKWLIENPVAASYFDLKWVPQQNRIFMCGRVNCRKNTLGALKVFNAVLSKFPDSKLVVAGSSDTQYLMTCKQYIANNGLNGKVEFLGNADIKQVQQELTKASCLLIPSFQETAPLSIEEAMAVGVPVIGSKLCGMPYMIKNGSTGFLIDPYDSQSIVQAIITLFESAELIKTMSSNAKRIASERFRASVIARDTVEVYNCVLNEYKET